MKLFIRTLSLSLFVLLSGNGMGQMGQMINTSILEGDFNALKGQKNVDVQFVFDDMMVGTGLTEEQYVAKKTKEYNEKEAGKGDTWAIAWVNDRERLYYPKFLELFNARSEGSPLASVNNEAAEYRLVVRTVSTEPGYNIGISRKPAMIGASVKLVRIDAPDTVLGDLIIVNCPGGNAMGFDYDTGGRIAECYAKLGKELIVYLQKKQWK